MFSNRIQCGNFGGLVNDASERKTRSTYRNARSVNEVPKETVVRRQ